MIPVPVTGYRKKSVTWQESSDSEHAHEISPAVVASYNRRPTKLTKKSKSSVSLSGKNSKPLLAKLFGCCVDRDENEIWDDEETTTNRSFRMGNKRRPSEEEILGKLQQAVNELGHREPYELESEVAKWHKILELEQKAYEESGRPKFKYKFFRKNRYLMLSNHPLYATSYDNYRRLETRSELFRFGANLDERFVLNENMARQIHFDAFDQTSYHDSGTWRNDLHTAFATMSLICSAIIFLLTYCLMIVAVGQPLLYFEMVLGQYSLHGPSGFANLHPFAKGIPYANAFVCVVFGTSKSIILAYCMLYSLLSFATSPGKCGRWLRGFTNCFPYAQLESNTTLLQHLWSNRTSNATYQSPSITTFSTELFFREVILDTAWRMNHKEGFIQWKLLVAAIIVFSLAYIPIHYKLTGKTMRKWMYQTLILPLMILLLFFHQTFERGAASQAVSYFVTIHTEHVSALTLWSEAFEMVLSTLGIGYGFHWSISGRTSCDYRKTYRTSWIICGYAVLFGVVSSLVIFCEIGIVGEAVQYSAYNESHVFVERLGISFVCYCGALLKLGANSTIWVTIFFLGMVVYGMWSQIIISDIILRWIEHGHVIKGKVRHIVTRKVSSVCLVVCLQTVIILPYLFERGSSVLDSENLFGGSLAAYTVVLAEVVVVVYAYGFARFLVDLEIMTKHPLPALFQIQIRYIVIPATGILMIPMIVNAYFIPSIYIDRNSIGWLLYPGVAANFVPLGIILFFGSGILSRKVDETKKVNPEPYLYGENIDVLRMRMPIEQRFVATYNAPSQQSHSRTIRSEAYHFVQHKMNYIYQAQLVVQKEFRKLLKFKRVQTRWLKLALLSIWRNRVRSMKRLVERLMLQRHYDNNRVDVRFLEKTLEQIVNFTFFSSVRRIQRIPVKELLPFLADELIKQTTFHPVDFLDSDDSSYDSSTSTKDIVRLDASSSSSTEEEERKEYLQIHRKIIGRLDRSPEESRVLLTIRLKRGLRLPYLEELSVLKFLRRERAKREREVSCWTMNEILPVDHFVPASISKEGDKLCFTMFHAVVVQGKDHFVTKRLSVPRPAIVRVTRSFILAQPGNTLTDKFSFIVTKRMHKNLSEILKRGNFKDWPKEQITRHLWKVVDRLDDDVYDFLDHSFTCIIVILDESEAQKQTLAPPMYLTPRTRRKIPKEETPRRKSRKTELNMMTYTELYVKKIEEAKLTKLRLQPSDITYHSGNSEGDSSDDKDNDAQDAISSSGSTSTEEGKEVLDLEPYSIISSKSSTSVSLSSASGAGSSRFTVSDETTTPKRRTRAAKTISRRASDTMITRIRHHDSFGIDPNKIRHISARKWKKLHQSTDTPTSLRYTDTEILLHGAVDIQAEKRAILPTMSVSADLIKSKQHLDLKKAFSLQSLRHMLDSEVEFDIQQGQLVAVPNEDLNVKHIEDKLGNTNPKLLFVPFGKTLIVSHGKGASTVSSTTPVEVDLHTAEPG